MEMQKLKKGDKVAIVSLSSGILGEPFIKHELDLGIKRLEELGLVPVFMDNTLKGLDYIRDNPKSRAEDLKKAFYDNEIKAIITAIGGNDSFKILPYLFDDEEFILAVKNNPKIFTGYSDTTTTHLALNKLGLNTFYGPAFITDFAEFENNMLPYTKNSLMYLFNAPNNYEIKPSDVWYKERTDFSPASVGTLREKFSETNGYEVLQGTGTATGKLIGGCLELFSMLSGYNTNGEDELQAERNKIMAKYPIIPTKEELSGKILFLETSDGKPTPENYRNMIKHLKSIGLFDNISGLLIGKPMDEAYYSEYKEILISELNEFNFPILFNLNFGHSFPRMTLPYGAVAEINADKKTLTLKSSTLK